MNLAGSQGLGERKRQGNEEAVALTLPLPPSPSRWPVNIRVQEDEFRACATCHVYVDPSWLARLEPREEMEEGMLENAWEPRDNSRLSCQIQITAELDGLEVTVPQRQREE